MPFIFRGIDDRTRWYKEQPDYSWLTTGQLWGDALKDLKTSKGVLSVYVLENDGEQNINRVVAAMAATRQAVDFESVIENGNYKIVNEEGKTPDKVVNVWHRDFVELTAIKLGHLGQVMYDLIVQDNGKTARVEKADVEGLLLTGLHSGKWDIEKVNKKLLQSLQP